MRITLKEATTSMQHPHGRTPPEQRAYSAAERFLRGCPGALGFLVGTLAPEEQSDRVEHALRAVLEAVLSGADAEALSGDVSIQRSGAAGALGGELTIRGGAFDEPNAFVSVKVFELLIEPAESRPALVFEPLREPNPYD